MKTLFTVILVFAVLFASFTVSEAAEWDWLMAANFVTLSNTTYGMLILPGNFGDEIIFYLAPADFVGQTTAGFCSLSPYDDPFNFYLTGSLSSFFESYFWLRPGSHKLFIFTCEYSSGGYGNVHMVAADNYLVGLTTTSVNDVKGAESVGPVPEEAINGLKDAIRKFMENN